MAAPLRAFLLRLPPDLHEAVRAKAAAEDRTMAQTIRRAIRLYLQGPAVGEKRGSF